MEIITDSACEQASGTAMYLENGVCTSEEASMPFAGQISKDMVCAGGGDTGVCFGDGGAPLSVKQSGKHSLVGMASFGYGCASVSYILYNSYHHISYISFYHKIACHYNTKVNIVQLGCLLQFPIFVVERAVDGMDGPPPSPGWLPTIPRIT